MNIKYRTKFIGLLALFGIMLNACTNGDDLNVAYGNFEAKEWNVSSEIPGRLMAIPVSEGQMVEEGQLLGVVDTVALHLKKIQLLASIEAIRAQRQNAGPKVKLFNTQLSALQREKKRVSALLIDSLATQKQMDDLMSQIQLVEQQVNSAREQVELANRGIFAKIIPLKAQIEQIDDQIKRCRILSPVKGRVVIKLAERGEMIMPGMLIYKIAQLDTIILRAYITGNQLPLFQYGQHVNIKADNGTGGMTSYTGWVSWISSSAEFTPKIIQTAEDRVNLVYAVKIKVPNDGTLKLGMPGEVHLSTDNTATDTKE